MISQNIKQDNIYLIFCEIMKKKGYLHFPNLKSFKSHESNMKQTAKEIATLLLSEDPNEKENILQSHLQGKFVFLLHQENKSYKDKFLSFGEHLRQESEAKSQSKERNILEKRVKDIEARAIVARASKYQNDHNKKDEGAFYGNINDYPTNQPPKRHKVNFISPASQSDSNVNEHQQTIKSLKNIEQKLDEYEDEFVNIRNQIHMLQQQLYTNYEMLRNLSHDHRTRRQHKRAIMDE